MKPDEIGKVLYDIHLADGYVSNIPGQDSAKKVASAYYKGIYKKFGIDSAIYSQNMTYYYAHPEELEKIYNKITKKLNNQKRMMEKADSVRNAKKNAPAPLVK